MLPLDVHEHTHTRSGVKKECEVLRCSGSYALLSAISLESSTVTWKFTPRIILMVEELHSLSSSLFLNSCLCYVQHVHGGEVLRAERTNTKRGKTYFTVQKWLQNQ